MKTIKSILALAMILFCANGASALDLKSILKSASDKASEKSSTTSTIGSIVGSLLSSDKITVADMEGNWKYSSPAVKFRSDNLLQKAGGAAATGVIEDKLKTYYKTAGFENMTLTVSADSTFTMKVRNITLSGTIAPVTDENSDANFVFQFKAIKKINIGQMNTYVSKSATGQLDITFDVSKLIVLVDKVSSLTGNKTLSSVSSLLKSYDGICAGFRVEKQ